MKARLLKPHEDNGLGESRLPVAVKDDVLHRGNAPNKHRVWSGVTAPSRMSSGSTVVAFGEKASEKTTAIRSRLARG